MWLLDRLKRTRETETPIANDPSLPLASILIRSMDRPTLQRALRSAAKQTWGNVEIVVIAACGRRHKLLPDTLLGRPLRLVFPEPDRQLPRPEAANMALETARGEWLNFLDDDDELLPEHLSTLLGAPRPARERVVYAITQVHDAKDRTIARIGSPGHHLQLYFHNRSTTCATLLHRSLIDEGVRFDPGFAVHEDHDFQIACATRTPFRFVDAATSVWHSEAGESGCGFGANCDHAQRVAAVTRVREKWDKPLQRWLHDADALVHIGQGYLGAGDIGAALECAERAVALRGSDAQALQLAGVANFRAGDLARAEMLLTKALKRLPKHPGLRENLAQVKAARKPAS